MSFNQKPFLPPQLMSTHYSARFPYGAPLPTKNNILSTTQKPQAISATASGVQAAMNKNSAYRGLGDIPTGAGPQQMAQALAMLNQAKTLADPTNSLQAVGLPRPNFELMLDELADQPKGQNYDFKALKKNPKKSALLAGLTGGAAVGGLSHLGGTSTLDTLRNALVGGGIGAGAGYLSAGRHNKDLLGTAKILNQYGLNRPEYLQQALPLLKASNERPTKAESKMTKYKTDPAHHAQGEAAFKSLDAYMKKAGLNAFQATFFSRLINAGLNYNQVKQATKQAGLKFGSDVASELELGFKKLAEVPGNLNLGINRAMHGDATGLPSSGYNTGLGKLLSRGATSLNDVATQFTGSSINQIPKFQETMNTAQTKINDLSNQAQGLMGKAQDFLGGGEGLGDMLKQYGPLLAMTALGAGGGGMLGGRGGAAMGGLSLPLMYYLMTQMQQGKNPLGGLFGGAQQTQPPAKPQQPPAQVPGLEMPSGPDAFQPAPGNAQAFNRPRQPLPVSGRMMG